MRFNYQARTKEGEVKSGIVEASTKEAALALLEKYGLYVTFLEESKALPVYLRKMKLFERVSRVEIVGFSRQLAMLFRSRIPIVEIFYTLGRQTKNSFFREKIVDIAETVEGGGSLSNALARHPKIFDLFYVNMVKSGEVSGNLPEVLDYLADHLERDHDFRSKIMGATIYPVVILIVVIIVIAAMAFFVIPKLEEVMKELGGEVPTITKIVFGFAGFVRERGLVLFFVILVLLFFLYRFSKSKKGKAIVDKIFLKFPIIGPFLQKVYLTRFAENLATLISGGVSITQSLEITGDIVGSEVFRNIILEARDGVKKGETISSILEAHPESIPPLFTQMTLVGERAGQISTALRSVVNFYRKDVDRTLENFVSFLEPLMIIFLGGVVALIVVSVLLPIYQIGLGGGM